MSQSASTSSRQRRGGRPQNRSSEHGSRDQHQRQRYQRDTETFQRPKGGPKLSFWEKLLSLVGLGPKPPMRRSDRVAADSTRSERPAGSRTGGRDGRPPREPRAPRPVIQHEVTSGRLYVGNLSYDVTESDLTELFSGVGEVKGVEVVVNRTTQRSKGFAFVEMVGVEQAKRAVAELHDQEYMGRKMLVTGAKASDGPRSGDFSPREGSRREELVREAGARDDDQRPLEARSHASRSEGSRGEGRPPRREDRTVGPMSGDVTTGIVRRESLENGPVPVAGPVVPPASETPAP